MLTLFLIDDISARPSLRQVLVIASLTRTRWYKASCVEREGGWLRHIIIHNCSLVLLGEKVSLKLHFT